MQEARGKGNISNPFNTDRVYAINGILINIIDICICIGFPKPHLRRSRLAAGVFAFAKSKYVVEITVCVHICEHVRFLCIFGNTK